MKSKLLAFGVAAALSSYASADALAIKAGISGWDTSADTDTFETSDTTVSGWVAFEHPVPFVPNIKIRANQFDSDALSQETTDFILYYELLDNPLAILDLGFGAQRLSDITIAGESFDGVVPELYLSTRLPFFDRDEGLGFYAEGVATAMDDLDMYDIEVGLSYSFSLTALDLHLRGGYRASEYSYSDFDGLFSDQSFDGVIFGLEFDL